MRGARDLGHGRHTSLQRPVAVGWEITADPGRAAGEACPTTVGGCRVGGVMALQRSARVNPAPAAKPPNVPQLSTATSASTHASAGWSAS